MSEQKLYVSHLNELQQRLARALERDAHMRHDSSPLAGLALFSGIPKRYYLDDHDYPFTVNPQFKAWLPLTDNPWCLLLVNGVDKPVLFYYRPQDYWHVVAGDPEKLFWSSEFDIRCFSSPDELAQMLPDNREQWAFVGEELTWASEVGLGAQDVSPVLTELDYYRAYKTDYELACIRQANAMAIKGHQAARDAFYGGQSELGIHLAYQGAADQSESELPYGSIVALNQHGAILHYKRFETQSPALSRSFLLDAGAEYSGYAADITRSYAAEGAEHDAFRVLIQRMDRLQQEVIAEIIPGQTDYVALHEVTHKKLAQVLVDSELVSCSADEAFAAGITRTFLPHGLGHLIGLQVHDVAGFAQDIAGTHRPAPAEYPALRLTRVLEPGMVVTIEPGLYFIDSLLDTLKQSDAGRLVNWSQVEVLRPYGGIRIEDNIVIHQAQVENITRDLGLG